MSDLTPTCEEGLVEVLRDCPDDHFIAIKSSGKENFLSIYRVPLVEADEFNAMNRETRERYWTRGFGTIYMHKEVWKDGPNEGKARRYR